MKRDALANDGDVTVHRERAKTMLDQIAAEVKQNSHRAGYRPDPGVRPPASSHSAALRIPEPNQWPLSTGTRNLRECPAERLPYMARKQYRPGQHQGVTSSQVRPELLAPVRLRGQWRSSGQQRDAWPSPKLAKG